MRKELEIGIDFDGVLGDFDSCMRLVASRRGICLDSIHTRWDYLPELEAQGLSTAQGMALIQEAVDSIDDEPPYGENVRWLRRWDRAYIITERVENDPIMSWLRRMGLRNAVVISTFLTDKWMVCKDLGLRGLVDDSPRHVQKALDNGVEAHLMLRSWNINWWLKHPRREAINGITYLEALNAGY